MYELRRWWDRYGLQVTLTTLAVGTAFVIRQTQAGFLMETYEGLMRPFQTKPTAQERLANAQALELQQRLIELESKNQRLEELLGFVQSKTVKGVPAPVIGRSADHWWQQVLLGRGTNHGVKNGSIVLSPGGLVGRVTQATPNASRVLLLSDPSSRVGVMVSRSRSMGYMRGMLGNRATLEFFDKVPEVRQGDVITTSSFSQLFPVGIPVGRVESVDLTKSPAPEAVIELSAPIRYLEWTVIYPHSPSLAEPLPPVAPTVTPTPSVSPSASPSATGEPDPDAIASPSPDPTASPTPTP
jgi:rod shape-determining protein MreC